MHRLTSCQNAGTYTLFFSMHTYVEERNICIHTFFSIHTYVEERNICIHTFFFIHTYVEERNVEEV